MDRMLTLCYFTPTDSRDMWVTTQSAGEETGRKDTCVNRSAGIRLELQTLKPSPDADAVLETLPFSLWQVGDLASFKAVSDGTLLPRGTAQGGTPKVVPLRSGFYVPVVPLSKLRADQP